MPSVWDRLTKLTCLANHGDPLSIGNVANCGTINIPFEVYFEIILSFLLLFFLTWSLCDYFLNLIIPVHVFLALQSQGLAFIYLFVFQNI